MCLPPDTSPDDCECTPEYLDCSSDYEEYSNWDSHCTLENPNPHYEYKCCLPKWYFAPIPEYDPLEGKVGNQKAIGIKQFCHFSLNTFFHGLLVPCEVYLQIPNLNKISCTCVGIAIVHELT